MSADAASLESLQGEAQLLAARMRALPYAWGGPLAHGVLRAQPEDFRVDEELKTLPSGSGGHWWLRIEKRSVNTQWVVREMARALQVPQREIGYGGLKDRHAVATQWFSAPDQEGVEARIAALAHHDNWKVIDAIRHERKLRHGVVGGNRFTIVVREFAGDAAAVAERMARIDAAGVPNYFTEQRFGFDNVGAAAAMFAGDVSARVGHHERGLYLSAARSALFNWVLADRVDQGSWNILQPGEAVALAGSHSFFLAEHIDDVLRERAARRDVTPSAPLWGVGPVPTSGAVASHETVALDGFGGFRRGLEQAGLKQERRPTVLYVADVQHEYRAASQELCVRFLLPAGCFATAVLREIAQYQT